MYSQLTLMLMLAPRLCDCVVAAVARLLTPHRNSTPSSSLRGVISSTDTVAASRSAARVVLARSGTSLRPRVQVMSGAGEPPREEQVRV